MEIHSSSRFARVIGFAAALVLPATPAVADYVNPNATDFSTCPLIDPNGGPQPVSTDPGTSTTTLIGLASGTFYSGDPGANNSSNRRPLGVHTWYGTSGGASHHWVFVGTHFGIDVFDMETGAPVKKGTIDSTHGYRGMTTVSLGVAGERVLVGLDSDSHLRSFRINFSSPTSVLGTSGDLDLNNPFITVFPASHIDACGTAGAEAGSWDVVASTTTPGHVFITNECTDTPRGSLDVVDVSTPSSPVLHQRVALDKNPTGVVLSPDESTLFVSNEVAGSVTQALMHVTTVGPSVGSLMTFTVAHMASSVSVTLKTAVNPGCIPSRVAVSASHVWVTARNSNDIQVFNSTNLIANPANARTAVFRAGPQPAGIRVVHGNNIAVANSYRYSNRNSTDPADPYHYPKPSVMVFNIDALTAMSGWGNHGTTRLTPTPCLIKGTPNGYGDFPRNMAEDDERTYVTLFGASAVKWINDTNLDSACP